MTNVKIERKYVVFGITEENRVCAERDEYNTYLKQAILKTFDSEIEAISYLTNELKENRPLGTIEKEYLVLDKLVVTVSPKNGEAQEQ